MTGNAKMFHVKHFVFSDDCHFAFNVYDFGQAKFLDQAVGDRVIRREFRSGVRVAPDSDVFAALRAVDVEQVVRRLLFCRSL